MDILIINHRNNNRLTKYTPSELRREAVALARKNKAKLEDFFVEFHEGLGVGAQAHLCVTMKHPDGWSTQQKIVI